MLEEAVKSGCDYYHFLSGSDYPIKPMGQIHRFFEQHAGQEFIYIAGDDFARNVSYRYECYHPLQEIVKRDLKNPLYYVEALIVKAQQKLLRVDRTRKYPDLVFRGGSNWCSFTAEFAAYLLAKEAEIQRIFHQSLCCDEIFLQTIFYNSPFYKNVHQAEGYTPNLRKIDWTRGNPYTFTAADFDELCRSECLFCRKVAMTTEEQRALLDKLDEMERTEA